MRKLRCIVSIGLTLLCWAAQAQVAPVAAADQLALLASDDPHLARNKETYIQHNPNVGSGRAAYATGRTRTTSTTSPGSTCSVSMPRG